MTPRTLTLLTVFLSLGAAHVLLADTQIISPDGRWVANVVTSPELKIQVSQGDSAPFLTQEIGLKLADGRSVGEAGSAKVATRSVNEEVKPVAPTKAAVLHDHFNEAALDFGTGFSLEVRAYNDGVAYRFVTRFPGAIVVASEKQVNSFNGDPVARMPVEKNEFYSHTEATFIHAPLSQFETKSLTYLPVLLHAANNGPRMVFSETALEDYPGQWLRVGRKGTLIGAWPQYALGEEEKGDRDIVVTKRAEEIARTQGTRAFPWRFVALGVTDGDLLLNELSYLLAEPSRIKDTSWIKPGKVQWDWWHDMNVWDADFEGGVSQQLYKHYIDFASENNSKYIVLDEGWYELGDLTKAKNGIDVPDLVAYGKKKKVGVILWASWATLKKQFDLFMPQVEKWGVAGLKVDFFQRDDQAAVDFYWKLSADAASRKLLMDYHGAHKPAGLQRTYPNVLTFEGVKGLENNKWSEAITPEHDVTLPFTRMVAGPMDYTPGAMDNAQKEQFRIINRRPMSQGTRAHQLALYVIYESPLQMLADSPSAYRREEISMKFLRAVPVLWDETRVLAAEVGKVVALARRSGDRWFVGVLNGNEAKTLELDLSFMGKAAKTLQVWQDGPNAARDARDVHYQEKLKVKDGQITVKLAPGGGWTAIGEK